MDHPQVTQNTLIRYEYHDNTLLKKINVRKGDIVLKDRILLIHETNGKRLTIKSPITGVIENLFIKPNESIAHNQILFEILPGCPHNTVLMDVCAICGEEVLKEEKPLENNYIPLIHKIPELRVDREHAIIMGKADEERLLRERRLILIVDLDHTIIHTTNEEIPADIKDVHHYQLPNSYHNWYHTKCRPHTREFLVNISKYFELHICTFGARAYAHMIANIIDKEGKLFSHRILSRDEFLDPSSKTANLKALFPFGDSLVCIIDDREDVWNFVPNVVHVKPYKFFDCSEEINLPPGATQEILDIGHSKYITDLEIKNDEKGDNESSKKEEIDSDQMIHGDLNQFIGSTKTQVLTNVWKDSDDYLYYLEDILIKIHEKYYKCYDKFLTSKQNDKSDSSPMPSLQQIIPEIRKEVLSGVNIVFSGIFPKHVALEDSKERKIAIALGATVSPEIQVNVTTHLIAAIKGTNKLHRAKKLGMHVVTIDWLYSCYERWERASELLFPLQETDILIENRCKAPKTHWNLAPFVHEESFKIHRQSVPTTFQGKMELKNELAPPLIPLEKVSQASPVEIYYDKVTGKKITRDKAQINRNVGLNQDYKKDFIASNRVPFNRVQPKPLTEDLIKNMEEEIFEALNESDGEDEEEDAESNASLSENELWFPDTLLHPKAHSRSKVAPGLETKNIKRKKR